MNISTRGRYAIRIMLDIAMNGDGAPVPLKDVSARQEISLKYMEQIVSALVRAGYLRGFRGSQGGYRLIDDPKDISVGNVLFAIEGPIRLAQCEGCPRSEGCLTAPMWRHLEEAARQAVYCISLQSLIDGDFAYSAGRPAVTVPAAAERPAMQRYTVLNRSDGMTVRASGDTLGECFANVGYALFDQTAEMAEVEPSEEVEFTVSGADHGDRLHAFLSELLEIKDREGLVLKEFDIRFEDDSVHCIARGEVPELSEYRLGQEVKAVDRNMVEIDEDGPSVTVVFDM